MTLNAHEEAPQQEQFQRLQVAVSDLYKVLASLAVPLWRAERRLAQEADPGPVIVAPLRNVQRALDILGRSGIVIKDYLGEEYDPGMTAAVMPLAFRESDTCQVETIIETSSPAVFVGHQLLHRAEVIVGFPPPPTPPQPAAPGAEIDGTAADMPVNAAEAEPAPAPVRRRKAAGPTRSRAKRGRKSSKG